MNLITGGAGFIGIHIARQLLARGEAVRIVDLAAPAGEPPQGRWEFVRADVRDRDRVIEACRGVRRIFHIAALVPISKAGRAFWDVNVGGTRNVLDGAMRHGVRKVLHMSSSAVLGSGGPALSTRPPRWTRSASTPGPRPTANPCASTTGEGGWTFPSSARARSSVPAAWESSRSCSTGFGPERPSTSSGPARTGSSSSRSRNWPMPASG